MSTSSKRRKKIAPSIPSQFLMDALVGYEFRGYNLDKLLASEGLSKNNLLVTGHRISIRDYSSLLKRAAHEMNDASLGFLENKMPLAAPSVFALGLASSRNIQEVISYCNQFYGLFTSQVRLDMCVQGDACTISLSFSEQSPIDYRSFYQGVLLHCIRLLSWLVGETISPLSVSFTFAQQGHESHMSYLLGNNIQFSQDENTVALPGQVATTPISTNIDQIAVMLQEAETMMLIPDSSNPFSREIRKNIILCKHDHWPQITDIADMMNICPHLLWRKLKKERTTFSHIRNEVKRDWALTLVQDRSLSVEQIAEELRFSDVSAYHKAFKKWTGMRTSEYRARLLE